MQIFFVQTLGQQRRETSRAGPSFIAMQPWVFCPYVFMVAALDWELEGRSVLETVLLFGRGLSKGGFIQRTARPVKFVEGPRLVLGLQFSLISHLPAQSSSHWSITLLVSGAPSWILSGASAYKRQSNENMLHACSSHQGITWLGEIES